MLFWSFLKYILIKDEENVIFKFFYDGCLSFKTADQLLFCHFLRKLASEVLQVGSMVDCSMLDYLRDGTAHILNIGFLLKMLSNIWF